MSFVPNKTFFKDVSARASYVDPSSIEKIYYAIVKTILVEIDKNGVIYLPDFGKFHLIDVADKVVPGINGGPLQCWPGRKILRFKAGKKLQSYLRKKT